MDLPLIIMFASFLAALGGRARHIVSELAGSLGRSPALPNVVTLSCAVTAFAMAYLGAFMSPFLGELTRDMLASGALVLAAIDLLWREPPTPMREPTRSFGAIWLTLTARQIFDAPRWFAFAAGVAAFETLGAALGATLGSAIALFLGWFAYDFPIQISHLRGIRQLVALGSMMAAAAVMFHSLAS